MLIRGARGLGDSFYLRAVVKYFLDGGKKDITVMTNYPVMFEDLPVKCIKHDGGNPDLNVRYASRLGIQTTNLLEDTTIMAGIEDKLELNYPHQKKRVFNTNKKVVIIKSLVYPHKGRENTLPLIPKTQIFQNIINTFFKDCYFVLLGLRNKYKFELRGIQENLSEVNDLKEYIKILDSADIVITQPGHILPMCEAVNTPCLVIFSAKGLQSQEYFWKWVTPQKLITRTDMTKSAIDDNTNFSLTQFESLLNKVKRGNNG